MLRKQFKATANAFKRVSLSTWLLLLLGLATLAVLGLLGSWLSPWFFRADQDWKALHQQGTKATNKEQFDASLEMVKAILGGLATLSTVGGGVFVLWNIRLTQTRLITERFSKAVEQLGSDKIEVRLGASMP